MNSDLITFLIFTALIVYCVLAISAARRLTRSRTAHIVACRKLVGRYLEEKQNLEKITEIRKEMLEALLLATFDPAHIFFPILRWQEMEQTLGIKDDIEMPIEDFIEKYSPKGAVK